MRVLLINAVCGTGSTGRICTDLAKQFEKDGNEVKIAYGRKDDVPEEYRKYALRIGSDIDCKLHGIETRLFDNHGFASRRATRKFIKWAEEYNPDILWLHNLHGYYINVQMLFDWIKSRTNMQVRWTLHDCWAFTGHCAYFSYVKCNKWQKECNKCCQLKRYPACFGLSFVKKNYIRKKKAFTGVDKMTLYTPSEWLANLVKKSFLKDYPIVVKHNEIDRNIFKPIHGNLKKRYNIEKKFVVLGVANVWEDRKGLNDFYELNNLLNENYQIILVGLSEKQIKKLPNEIIGIHHTQKVEELVEIYSDADVYVSTSVEETFGMTVIEALSCGTNAIVYSGTACEEVAKNNGGIVVDNLNELYMKIIELKNNMIEA